MDTQGSVWTEVSRATNQVAFSVEYGNEVSGGMWVMNLDGKNLHRPFPLVWNDKEKWKPLHPSWSSDGTKLVYSEEGGVRRLAIYDLVKKERRQLTNGPRDEQPVWSPKGDWIAYMHCLQCDDKYAKTRIWLVKPDGSEQKPVVDEKGKPIRGWWPSWSPDALKVGITSDLLYIADLESHKTEYIDPKPILGERMPWTFMGHHWGKRGWLLNRSGIVVIDDVSKKAHKLAATGIYGGTASGGGDRWGAAPFDMEGKPLEQHK